MIVVFGSVNLDLIFPVHALPQLGETVLTAATRLEPGGKGANQAVAAARDGARVVMAGAVGRDSLAEAALAGLVAAGVDARRVVRTDAATGCAAVVVDELAHNMIVVGSGANLVARAEQVEDALLGPAATLVLQMECAPDETAALIRRARAQGTRILLNLAPAAPLPADALRAVDVLLLNDGEAGWLGEHLGTGTNAASLHAALGVDVIVTHGPQGVEAMTRADGYLRVEACPVEARDSTGAGDCFAGVLAAALDAGDSFRAALRRANVAAALSCLRFGAQASFPGRDEIDAAFPASPAPTSREVPSED